jgi:hypothetical protein
VVPMQIQLFPFSRSQWHLAVECMRRPSLLGVPTVLHDGLVLFTGRTVLKIYAASPVRVARSLRRVAEDTLVRTLPPPTAVAEQTQGRVCR